LVAPQTISCGSGFPAEPDRLLEAGQLLDLQHPADHQATLDGGRLVDDRLDLHAQVDQRLVELLDGQGGGQLDVLAQPRQ
jgi:hypothetical protein